MSDRLTVDPLIGWVIGAIVLFVAVVLGYTIIQLYQTPGALETLFVFLCFVFVPWAVGELIHRRFLD